MLQRVFMGCKVGRLLRAACGLQLYSLQCPKSCCSAQPFLSPGRRCMPCTGKTCSIQLRKQAGLVRAAVCSAIAIERISWVPPCASNRSLPGCWLCVGPKGASLRQVVRLRSLASATGDTGVVLGLARLGWAAMLRPSSSARTRSHPLEFPRTHLGKLLQTPVVVGPGLVGPETLMGPDIQV